MRRQPPYPPPAISATVAGGCGLAADGKTFEMFVPSASARRTLLPRHSIVPPLIVHVNSPPVPISDAGDVIAFTGESIVPPFVPVPTCPSLLLPQQYVSVPTSAHVCVHAIET